MVKIAIAGASGKLGLEVTHKLAESGKYEIIGLVRRWIRTTCQDKKELVEILTGVHTVLSFLVDAVADPHATLQRSLVDASIEAKVKRIAPSEWAIGQKLTEVIEFMPWYSDKLAVRKHLQEVNKDGKVIEYTLFQPGSFTNYLAYPNQTAKHYQINYPTLIDVNNARGVILEGSENSEWSLTTIEDIAEMASRAVGYDGVWPEVGGISGQRITVAELIRLAEKVTGEQFKIHKVKLEDVRSGNVETGLLPRIPIPGLSEEQVDHFSRVVTIGMMVSVAREAWVVSDEWNRLLPEWKPTQVEEYLKKTWGSK